MFGPGLSRCGGDSDVCVAAAACCPVGYHCGRTGFLKRLTQVSVQKCCVWHLLSHPNRINFVYNLAAPTALKSLISKGLKKNDADSDKMSAQQKGKGKIIDIISCYKPSA